MALIAFLLLIALAIAVGLLIRGNDEKKYEQCLTDGWQDTCSAIKNDTGYDCETELVDCNRNLRPWREVFCTGDCT